MRIDFHGRLAEAPRVRAGFIGCGSHSFRNLYPVFQFASVELVATCDLDLAKAQAFARQFGATAAYASHQEMLRREKLDAAFIVTGYDPQGRPLYPKLAADCLSAGCHVFIEKPPAASGTEIETLQAASASAGKSVMVGFKKMFFPILEKAKALAEDPSFGRITLVTTSYPLAIPTVEEMRRYHDDREPVKAVIGFLDHLCHPLSRLAYLLGAPKTLYYERTPSGAGSATLAYADGAVATLVLPHGQSSNGGLEETRIVSDRQGHIVIENNLRLVLARGPELVGGYGATTSFYGGAPEQASAVWEPEFSLGQLYNKGLFMLGYYGEVEEFAQSILQGRPPAKGTLEQAWHITRVFEAFAEGPGKVIRLSTTGKDFPCAT
jgi:predicted dehydrogenase